MMEPMSDSPKQEPVLQSQNILPQQPGNSARIIMVVGVLLLLVVGIGAYFPNLLTKNATLDERQTVVVATSTNAEIEKEDPLSTAPKDVILDLDKNVFPKTIGEYSVAWAYEIPGKEGERSTFEVAYERTKPSQARIFIYRRNFTAKDIAEGQKSMEVKTYKQSKIYCDSADEQAGCSWETEGDLNVVTVLYSVYDAETKVWVDRAPLEYGANAELVVLDWFLDTFPPRH